jgi:hypothetical protein
VKLLGQERIGNAVEKYWLHSDGMGRDQITVETVEDVEPVFKKVRQLSEERHKDLRYKASIPGVVISEVCRSMAPVWGVKRREVFRELVENKTDRAKKVWKMLTEARDYRKFQAWR